MCLHPEAVPPIPETTVCVARAAFPKGNLFMSMRDELGIFFEDLDFADLYPSRGQSAEAPWRLAMITIMQYMEGLTDRQAAEAVRARIDWKYALSLELVDPGFHYSVFSEFRDRLIAADAGQRLLDQMLLKFQEKELLKARGKQRTDSTHVLAAIRELSRLEFLGETLRHALNVLAEQVPDWLQSQVPPSWYDRYGKRFEDARLPTKPNERTAYACQIGADGFLLLDAIYADNVPPGLSQLPAIETLRQVWLQQFYAPGDGVELRAAKDRPPGALRLRSPYDSEARWSRKSALKWTGYKVHFSESCDEDLPRLITHVETTPSTTQDKSTTDIIHQALTEKQLQPQQHLVDQGYTCAQLLLSSEKDYGIDLVGPVATKVQWQAQEGTGFALPDFQVNWNHKQVTCPQGKISCTWQPAKNGYGNPVIHVNFRHKDCSACPVRSQCTRAKTGSRSLTFKVKEEYEALQQARERQETEDFQELYALRAGVEGTHSQAIRGFGLRQCRYMGQTKTHLQHVLTAAAMNVVRAIAWIEEVPLAQTRKSSFAKLAPAP